MGIEALFAKRNANQNTRAAARFTNVPPAATRRVSDALDHATVVSSPDFAPVSRAVSPWPTPSCRTFETIAARALIAQIVSASSALSDGCLSCESTGVEIEVSVI